VIATHQLHGVRCEGSGSQPSEITPSAGMSSTTADSGIKGPAPPSVVNDPNPLMPCPVCRRQVGVESGLLAVHETNGSRCVGSGIHAGAPPKSAKPTVTNWLVFAAVCLLVLWLPVSCVAGNISDGGRMDRAVAYICQSWVKAANEHPGEVSSGAPDSTGLDQSEIDKRVEAQCGDSKRAWENWASSSSAASPTTDPSPMPRSLNLIVV
jgi:hypothetical protein